MGSLWESKTCVKKTTRPLNLCFVYQGGLDLSKEALLASVGQRAAKLLAVKVGDSPKVCQFGHYSQSACMHTRPGLSSTRVQSFSEFERQ